MRSHEFVTEAVTIANYRTLFTDAIWTGIKSTLDTVGRMQSSLVASVKLNPHQTNTVKSVALGYKDKFSQILQASLTYELSKVVQELLNQRYPGVETPEKYVTYLKKVTFLKMSNQGEASLLDILLNDRFISRITDIIIDFINNNYLDLIGYDEQGTVTDQFFTSIKALAATDVLSYEKRLTDNVVELSDIILHELVHVFQSAEQLKKGRDNLEYRSYFEKDPEKFRAAIRRMSTPSDYWIHRGSPQEITAWAHGIASRIIKDFDLEQYPNNIEQSQFYDIISHYLVEHLQYSPGQIRELPPLERKVFNRYAKQIYLILQHYIETRNKELKG